MMVMSAPLVTLETPEAIVEFMTECGGESYFGEPVTVLEHCLQAAYFAREADSSNAQIVAALLHDLGHLLHREGEDVADRGVDTRHEELPDRILSAHLPTAVTEPIRLHVAAKRYLCSVDSAYLDALSPSSVLSLGLQGGPMSRGESEAFLRLPFAPESIALRHWDDEAKIADLQVPEIGSYLPLLKALWR
jgi:phosphonate degradation associated HDIG domain protein